MSRIHGMTAALREKDYSSASFPELIETFLSVTKLVLDEASGEEWDAAYDECFGGSIGEAQKAIYQETGLRLEYYDPDTSYEEDVRAYLDTVRGQLEEYIAGYRRALSTLGGA